MVTKKRKKLSVIVAALSLALLTSACRGTEMPYDLPEPFESGKEQDEDISKKLFGLGEHNHGDEEDQPDVVMNGPDIPPEGTSYDEWKGIKYTTDTSFNLRSFWAMQGYDSYDMAEEGIVMYPEAIEDARLEIIDAKVEPIGGEMKLRSGGYVDITIETRWTGTMNYYVKPGYFAFPYSFCFSENPALPFDKYTGTSLINDLDTDDSEKDDINIGEAVDTGMVESGVTWKGQTYRLFAKSDTRNASFESSYTDYEEGKAIDVVPAAVETTLTLRVPADYDGLALAIDKDITDEKSSRISPKGEWLTNSDTYADILTTPAGVKQSPDDFYFLSVPALIEKFSSKHNQ